MTSTRPPPRAGAAARSDGGPDPAGPRPSTLRRFLFLCAPVRVSPSLRSAGGRMPAPSSGPAWKTDGGLGVQAEWIVTEADGTVVHPGTLLGRWKRLVKVAGVPVIPLHGARALLRRARALEWRSAGRREPHARPQQQRVHGGPVQPRQRRGGGRGGGSDRCGATQIAPGEISGKCEGAGLTGPFRLCW
jgi:hypothetical protein